SYPKLLVKIAVKGLDLSFGNYFIRSATLRRVIMMKKQTRINWTKVFMVLPLTAMLLVLVSMKTVREPHYPSEHTGETLQQESLEVFSLPEWRQGSVQNKAF